MKILMTGGTGFIGKSLCQALLAQGHEVTVFSRQPEDRVRSLCGASVGALSDLRSSPAEVRFDAIINLAGEGIADRRWSEARKQQLWDSRIGVTGALIAFMAGMEVRPKVLLSGSAVGYYGNRGDTVLAESADPGEDFSHRLCAAWEREALRAEDLGLRTCIIRTGLVVGPGGGFLSRMLPMFKLGLGGPIGDGNQWMSWIHLDDHIGLTLRLLNESSASGIYNATAPNPVSNREFTRCLAQVLGRPAFLPAPAPLLRLALGEMAELLLGGQRVLPKRLMELGFEFRYPHLQEALEDALGLAR